MWLQCARILRLWFYDSVDLDLRWLLWDQRHSAAIWVDRIQYSLIILLCMHKNI